MADTHMAFCSLMEVVAISGGRLDFEEYEEYEQDVDFVEMEEMLNINIGIVGRRNFPEFMMRFYVGTVGILFHAFLLTLFICEEDRNKMLYQPLLHGENRSRMIRSKIYVAVSMSMIFVLLVAFINYITAFMRWGYEIFEQAAFIRTITKYLLSGIYMSDITLGIVTLCICTSRTHGKQYFL